MNTILTTCGTSLLTNGADSRLRDLLKVHANAKAEVSVPADDRDAIRQRANAIATRLASSSLATVREMSAELNGLVGFYGGQLPARQDAARDQHWLIASDTWVGGLTRDLVAEWLHARGFSVQTPNVPDLRTDDADTFRAGIGELITLVHGVTASARADRRHIAMNLAGGFKSVNAFLQSLAMLWADEVFFIFESAQSLVQIPRLPVRLNLEDTVRAHLGAFRRLATGVAVGAAEADGIPETLLFRVDGGVALSVWGAAVWADTRRGIYAGAVHPPWCDRVRFGRGFAASVEDLPPDRRVLVNERIDDLGRYVLDGTNPGRLDVKKLQGGPVQGSTHECDAWADQDAKRLFLQYDGNALVVDRLDHGLH